MAERRMFSRKIIESSRFLKMPATSKLLYFYLCLSADDDGIVEAYNVMLMTGCREDDLRVLISKGYVTILDSEDMIAYINQWQLHNRVRPDRKVDSMYRDLLLRVIPDVCLVEMKDRSDQKSPRKSAGEPLLEIEIRRAGEAVERLEINEVDVSMEELEVSNAEELEASEEEEWAEEPGRMDASVSGEAMAMRNAARPSMDGPWEDPNHPPKSAVQPGKKLDGPWSADGPHRIGKVRIGKVRIGKDSIDQDIYIYAHDPDPAPQGGAREGSAGGKANGRRGAPKNSSILPDPCLEVLEYLNQTTGKAFSLQNKKYLEQIRRRLDDDYTVQELKEVIDKKTAEWNRPPTKGGIDMRRYLRPSTLFGENFEDYYVNQLAGGNYQQNRFNNFHQREYDYEKLEKELLNSQ